MRLVIFVFAILVTGCATPKDNAPVIAPEPVVVFRDRDVPVPQKCVPDSVTRKTPDYPDSKTALAQAANIFERAKLVAEANLLLHSRNEVLEEVLKGCQ